ncbi:MAG: D-alanyl-D-alanine carboxypeptidase family protein, partial [Chitinophagales bacterium]|nr:D-alanyl-D-alanine carboxypeptidase family protein [Chitinophagales bacterium]
MRSVPPQLLAIADELGIPQSLVVARGLSVCEEAESLVVVEVGENGREHLLVPSAAAAWRELRASAFEQGICLFIVSAFRSIERQAAIVRAKLSDGLRI